jgi:hypothetical protein
MTTILEGSSEARHNLLATMHRINNAKTTSVEISNNVGCATWKSRQLDLSLHV